VCVCVREREREKDSADEKCQGFRSLH
jgi:hypothetical protein